MLVLDKGHRYLVPNLEAAGTQEVVFIKRSSDMVQHPNEHPGTNTQELIRVLIDRTKYLDSIGSCVETQDALYYLRMALWSYEARAYRRKQQRLNKRAEPQAETGSPRANRLEWDDVPFTEERIEDYPTGPDGHIIVGAQ